MCVCCVFVSMYMCVCTCVCTCVFCVCVFVYVSTQNTITRVHANTEFQNLSVRLSLTQANECNTRTCMHTHMREHTNMFTHTCTHTHRFQSHTFASPLDRQSYVHTHAHARTRAHTHTHTHTHAHTCTHRFQSYDVHLSLTGPPTHPGSQPQTVCSGIMLACNEK